MLLQVSELNTFYDESRVLSDIALEVEKGELVAVLGRNGVGKSTMLKSIMGLAPPRTGSILFKGEELRGKRPYYIARRGIGYVPEERRIFPQLTVRENLIMGQKTDRRKRPEGAWSIDEVYERFSWLEKRDRMAAGNLSGGEQQVLTLVRTVMGAPELILIDEPSEGLSPIMVGVIFDLIKEIHEKGVSVVLVDRSLAHTCAMAARVYIIVKGSIVFTGSGEEVLKNKEIQEQFLAV